VSGRFEYCLESVFLERIAQHGLGLLDMMSWISIRFILSLGSAFEHCNDDTTSTISESQVDLVKSWWYSSQCVHIA
jgi:hypothetical protein